MQPLPQSLRLIEGCRRRISPDDAAITEWFEAFATGQKKRIAFDAEIFQQYVPPGAKVLEFGSVPLLCTAVLAEMGYAVTGIDLAPARFQKTIDQLGLKVIACNIETEKLPLPDNGYDAIVFSELFEHLRINLIFTMTEVLRVLRPNGILLLSTPNLRSLRGIVNFLLHNRSYSCAADLYSQYRKLDTVGHMGHVREYTTTEIASFLRRIGFSVDSMIFRGAYKAIAARLAIRVFPTLRPFVTYVARKPVPTATPNYQPS